MSGSRSVERDRDPISPSADEIARHYGSGYEAERLQSGEGRLDRERTRELLSRLLPPAPATILDVGGGPGGHACWLARNGYRVHLIDVVPLHVELARAASARQPDAPLASASVGDARSLPARDGDAEAVLLFGPLYHLTSRSDRGAALRESLRVLGAGGVLLAVGISRFASTLDGLRQGFLRDPGFVEIVDKDLTTGQHRNPTGHPGYFMDTFFHHPEELGREVQEAGFAAVEVYGVEGPGWILPPPEFDSWWGDDQLREHMLRLARRLEREPALLGISAHLMAVARKGKGRGR